MHIQHYILGIETSCDDSSLAVIDVNNGSIIAIVTIDQNEIHSKYQGIVPGLASLYHLYGLQECWLKIQKLVNNLSQQIQFIAVTHGPGLTGSLLMGVNFAYGLKKNIEETYNISINLYLTDHIEGHLLVNLCNKWVDPPFLGVILSGGHTLIIGVKDLGSYEIFATTLDDAIGECLDKCGRFLQLPYPGAIYLEKLALEGTELVPLTIPMVKSKSHQLSFSGLKTAVFYNKDKYDYKNLAKTIQWVAIKSVERSILKALKYFNQQYHIKNIVVGGGVISNEFFRQHLNKNNQWQWIFPGPGLSTDSGAMAASIVWCYYKKNLLNSLNQQWGIYNNLRSNKKFVWLDN